MTGDIMNKLPRPVTIRLPDDISIDHKLLEYCQKAYFPEYKRYDRLDNYYMTETDISSRRQEDPSKPNNRIAHAFARYISRISTAYFMGKGLRLECDDEEYKKELDDLLDANMTDIKHFEQAREMSKKGVAYELLYIDENGKLKTAALMADELTPVYGQSLDRYLSCAIRWYRVNNIVSGRLQGTDYADVYTKTHIYTYRRFKGGSWTMVEERLHMFGDVPVIVRWNNMERKGDYEDVITLIDAYDRAQSDTANDMDYFTDAYLAITGAEDIVSEGDDEENPDITKSVRAMKEQRTLIFPEGGDAKFITKDVVDTATENYKNRLYRDVFFLSMVPNLTDEDFAGNLSGVAIKYKLFGLEELAIEKEKYFTSSEMKKIRLITGYINRLKSKNYDWRTVTLKFDRSTIANLPEIANTMNALRDLLSEETLVGMWPEVESVAEEVKRLRLERDQEYNGGLPEDITEIINDG